MKRKAQGRIDGVAPDAVTGVEFVESSRVEIDLLRARLERIGDDRPNGRDRPPERPVGVARPAVIGDLW